MRKYHHSKIFYNNVSTKNCLFQLETTLAGVDMNCSDVPQRQPSRFVHHSNDLGLTKKRTCIDSIQPPISPTNSKQAHTYMQALVEPLTYRCDDCGIVECTYINHA